MNNAMALNNESNTDFEVRSLDHVADGKESITESSWSYTKYIFLGVVFGIILVKSEVVSWFRIQEMFRLESFYMFGIIGSAVAIAMLSLQLIKRFNIKTIHGDSIYLPQKKFNKGQIYGGLLFGLGWALTGACPGPMFAQIGTSAVVIVSLLSAIAGTWVYGLVRTKLPH